ncbi:MAG: hypothetical protein NVS3B10_29640 [Polyangiales bacterium]
MKTRRHLAWLSILGCLCLVPSCKDKDASTDKKDDKSSNSDDKKAADKKAKGDDDDDDDKSAKKKKGDDDDDDDKPSKKPHKKPADAKKSASKGGDGTKKPNKQSLKTETDPNDDEFQNKEKVTNPPSDVCDDEPNGAAECDGDRLLFCHDHTLFQVDCNKAAKKAGFNLGGSCFERSDQVDCMGCELADDGSTVCCDNENGICCDQDGFCWKG